MVQKIIENPASVPPFPQQNLVAQRKYNSPGHMRAELLQGKIYMNIYLDIFLPFPCVPLSNGSLVHCTRKYFLRSLHLRCTLTVFNKSYLKINKPFLSSLNQICYKLKKNLITIQMRLHKGFGAIQWTHRAAPQGRWKVKRFGGIIQ